jgi:hypothetical protein
MRKLIAAILVAGAAVPTGAAIAADMPFYPPVIDVPDVDYGYTGSFYLRGSGAVNLAWAKEVRHPSVVPPTFATDGYGYGYSFGTGFGYETGTGLRFDVTVDYLSNEGVQATIPASAAPVLAPGVHKLLLRSTVALANAYYDFGIGGDGYGAGGGMFGYVGAGAGVAFNNFTTTSPAGAPSDIWSTNTSFAAAAMAGVGYDFGAVVADVGYRGLYINQLNNPGTTVPYNIDNVLVHEVRGTVRYRFN